MNQSAFVTPQRRSSTLAIDKPTLLALIAASLLVTETFSGALRFYGDMAGISWMMYLPKIACLAAVALELPRLKMHRGIWLVLLLILTSCQLALLHGATLTNIGFTLFIYVPLLFGLICGKYLERRTALLGGFIGFCLAASLLGIALDMFTNVPWKGYSYMLGEVELSGNKAWAFGSTDRLAGFARMSTNLAVMLALYCLFLTAFISSRSARLVLYAITLTGIVLTTNKSTAAAFALTLGVLVILYYRLPSALAFLVAVLVGMALPALSLVLNIDPSSAYNTTLLSSFSDRLVNSWPNFIEVVVNQGWIWWGAGFGVVGSSNAVFPLPSLELLKIADNTALYLWGIFGVFGVLLYALLFPLMLRLHERGPRIRSALLAMVFCSCLIGWATDILEVTTSSLFLGMAIAHVLTPATRSAHRLAGLQRAARH